MQDFLFRPRISIIDYMCLLMINVFSQAYDSWIVTISLVIGYCLVIMLTQPAWGKFKVTKE